MSTHKHLVELLSTLAKKHKEIRHSIGGRVSFFLMNGEGERMLSQNNQVDYPILCLMDAQGRLRSSGDRSSSGTCTFDIRVNVSDAADWSAIEDARSYCKAIGENFIAYLEDMVDADGGCGPIADIDVEQVRWEFVGPMNLQEYGCRFTFPFEQASYNQYTQDLDLIFVKQFLSPLLDYDDEELLDFDDEPLTDVE